MVILFIKATIVSKSVIGDITHSFSINGFYLTVGKAIYGIYEM